MTKRFVISTKVWTKKEGTGGHNMDDWYEKEITEKKTVTDRMEERNIWKAVYAKNWFRNKYNLNGQRIINVVEVK